MNQAGPRRQNATAGKPPHPHLRAETLPEVLVVVFIILFIAGLLVPTLAKGKGHGHARVKCVNNLKNLGLALRIFATDNEGQFPWMVPIEKGGSWEELGDTNRIWRHFQALSNELSTPMILLCRSSPQTQTTRFGPRMTNDPGHHRQFSHNNHVSYFLTTGFVDGDAHGILSGDRNLTRSGQAIRGRIHPATNDVFGFTKPGHHAGDGNLLFADGSVQQVSSSKAAQVFTTGLAPIGTNPPPTVLIP
jgi:prepilin-type processing-associated H-X9-DG protein